MERQVPAGHHALASEVILWYAYPWARGLGRGLESDLCTCRVFLLQFEQNARRKSASLGMGAACCLGFTTKYEREKIEAPEPADK